MKLKHILHFAGLGHTPQRYGYEVRRVDLERYDSIDFAVWLHPKVGEDTLPTAAEVASCMDIVKEGDFCIDIGAHYGDTSVPLGLAAGASGLVLALEPNPYVYPTLEKNSRMNTDRYRILPMLAAAATASGSICLEYSDSGYCNGGRHEGVGVYTHGHFFRLWVHGVDLASELRSDFANWLPRLKMIKVDAEGYDLSILKSLVSIIDEYKPVLYVEVFGRTGIEYRRELLEFLNKYGYQSYRAEGGSYEAGEKITADNLLKWRHYDILAFPA